MEEIRKDLDKMEQEINKLMSEFHKKHGYIDLEISTNVQYQQTPIKGKIVVGYNTVVSAKI